MRNEAARRMSVLTSSWYDIESIKRSNDAIDQFYNTSNSQSKDFFTNEFQIIFFTRSKALVNNILMKY